MYQKARESNRCSGVAQETCHFYKELDAVLGGNLTFTKILVDTLGAWRQQTADSVPRMKS